MEHQARTVWPTLEDLDRWVSRNCLKCRYWTSPLPDLPSEPSCPITRRCLVAHLRDEVLLDAHARIIFNPLNLAEHAEPALTPHYCKSRKDKRGRPDRR